MTFEKQRFHALQEMTEQLSEYRMQVYHWSVID